MATVRDAALIGVLFFALAVGFLVIFFASQTIIGAMVMIPAINQSSSAVQVLNATESSMAQWDWLLFGAYIGMVLALIVTSWFVQGNAIYAFIYMLVAVVAVIVSAFLANIWEAITQNAALAGTAANFPIANHILTYLPMYTAVVAFIGLVVMFAKPQDGGI